MVTETPGLQVIVASFRMLGEVSKDLEEGAVSINSYLLSALLSRVYVGLSLGEKSFVVLKLALVELEI